MTSAFLRIGGSAALSVQGLGYRCLQVFLGNVVQSPMMSMNVKNHGKHAFGDGKGLIL